MGIAPVSKESRFNIPFSNVSSAGLPAPRAGCLSSRLARIAHEKLGSQTQKVRIPILENIEPKVQKPIGQDQDNLPV
ncbi:hypothetical protein RRG08_021954 [Elysia crispata]|uniref:Uncharacterized protein n=1 Tax=Elysia crispata TaxID=231223 RepID=A0AAE1AC40_9GAST|nr:hypothetical protein RRG08_021954 [Elysia crispata]